MLKRKFFSKRKEKKLNRWMEQCYQLFHADFESVSEMLQEVTATNS